MQFKQSLTNIVNAGPQIRQAVQRGNVRVLSSLLGPAFRGLVKQQAMGSDNTVMPTGQGIHFDWKYERDQAAMRKLYEAAKTSQWNASTDLDWSIDVDPENPERRLLPDEYLPIGKLPAFQRLSRKEKDRQVHSIMSWTLSQFLHGEQGALYAACQVTAAVPWTDGTLYGATQVVDEGRHVEVFHTYLTKKLEKLYHVNDNLYVIIDALMSDARWDVKFLGMQIMVEGLALGSFSIIYQVTREPLLREILKKVIADEARHVHYGVLSIKEFIRTGISERERREREDWVFEIALLLRDRFIGYELYEEFYAHTMTRKEWEQLLVNAELMQMFRKAMFKRIIPNLKRIGLLSDRIRPHYEQHGLLQFEHGKGAPELTAAELLE